MMKTKAPHTVLFVALLAAAACDASTPSSGRHVASEDESADDSDLGEALPSDDDRGRVPSAADEQQPSPAVATNGGSEPASAGVSAPTRSDASPSSEDGAAPAVTQFLVNGSTSSGLAASKAAKEALKAGADVRLSLLSDAGKLALVAHAKVDLDGKFSLSLPVDVRIDLGVAQLLDAAGKVVGSVLVSGAKGSAGGVLELAPISIESSLEVNVLLAALKCPCPPDKKPSAPSLALDVSALIDANLSNALDAALKLGVDADLVVAGLANALNAAAQARLEVLADLGVKLDAKLQRDAQLKALSTLGQGLFDVAGSKAKLTDVVSALALSLDGALSLSAKLDADLRARAQIAASLAFTSSLSGAFKADAKLNASVAAATHASAVLDAEITVNAVVELLEQGGASSVDVKAAISAGDKLKADVAASVDLKGLVAARKAFVEAVCGKPQGKGGLIGGLLGGTTDLVGGLLDGVLGSVLDLSVDLDAKLSLDLDAIASADACVSADASIGLNASLSLLADTLAKFDADVCASANVGVNASASAKAAAKVLVTAELFGRASI